MQRHLTCGFLRRQRLAGHKPTGFTLVELLVVIAIIAMLVGLLVPAVMRAREAGRRATCLNNQRQIGTAVMNFVTAKNKFPSLFTVQPPIPPVPADRTAVGWVPPMLPYLEQNPLYQIFQANGWNTLQNAEVETLICPSRDPTNSNAPLSYVVNAGMEDRYRDKADGEPLDYRENGLFFDNFCWQFVNDPFYKPPVIDLSSIPDGAQMTLMVSENTNARDWIAVNYPPGNPPVPSVSNFVPWQPDYSTVPSNPKTWWQGFTWRVRPPQPSLPNDWGLKGSANPGRILNQPPTGNPSDYTWGPPSSKHPGGFIVTMADGHSEFLSDEISYRVYCLLAAPDSNNVKDPLYKMEFAPGLRFKYPDLWYTGVQPVPLVAPLPLLKPVTEADINQ